LAPSDDAQDQLRDLLREVRAALAALDDEARSDMEETAPGSADRIAAAVDWVEHLMASVDPRLLSAGAFVTLHQPVSQLLTYLHNTRTYAANLPAGIDAIVLAAAPFVGATPPVRQLAQKAAPLARSAAARFKSLQEDTEALADQLAQLRADAEARDAELSATSEQRHAALLQQATSLEQTLTTQLQQAQTIATQMRSEFDVAQAERAAEHKDAFAAQQEAIDDAERRREAQLKNHAARLDTRVAEFEDRLGTQQTEHQQRLQKSYDDAVTKLDEDSEAALQAIDERRRKVEELYEVIFKTGTASAFSKEAKTERGTADTWRWIALAFGGAAILLAAITAFFGDATDLTPERLIARLAATAGLGALAAYAGRQSARHRRREEDAKQLELDLTAIAPFVEEVDETKRDDLRAQFVERWMGTRAPAAAGKPTDAEEVVGLPVAALAAALLEGLRSPK
jgi:hypothetical protein